MGYTSAMQMIVQLFWQIVMKLSNLIVTWCWDIMQLILHNDIKWQTCTNGLSLRQKTQHLKYSLTMAYQICWHTCKWWHPVYWILDSIDCQLLTLTLMVEYKKYWGSHLLTLVTIGSTRLSPNEDFKEPNPNYNSTINHDIIHKTQIVNTVCLTNVKAPNVHDHETLAFVKFKIQIDIKIKLLTVTMCLFLVLVFGWESNDSICTNAKKGFLRSVSGWLDFWT